MGDLLHFTGCRNLTILGADSATTEIRYADSLRYGAFDPATKLPYEAPTAFLPMAATLRAWVFASTCSVVKI